MRDYELTIHNHSSGIDCPHCGSEHFKVIDKVVVVDYNLDDALVMECQVCFLHFWNHISTSEEIQLFEVGDILLPCKVCPTQN